jgi:ABC-type antimicrobial peptide transport system permease subunit
VRLVVRDGLAMALPGVAAGVAVALLVTRFMRSMLYGVTATDPLVFGALLLVVLATAALAAFVPARRAAGGDPVTALREG